MDELDRKILQLPRVKRVLELIGLITITWNSIEELWYLIYTCLLHESPRNKVDQIFKQTNSGFAQRQLILSLVEAAFSPDSEFKKEFKKLIKATNELSTLRNSVIHGVYMFDHLNGEPGLRVLPGSSMKKNKNKLSEVGTELVNELDEVFKSLDKHESELEDFRIILLQEYLPNKHEFRPRTKEELEKFPETMRNNLPRHMLDRVAPDRLRTED